MTENHWVRLVDAEHDEYFAGTVFRFPGKYPYEDIVDLMMFDDYLNSNNELRLVVTTGFKAGLVNIIATFPREAYVEGSGGINAVELKKNWKDWVYDDCEVDDVFVIQNYPTPSSFTRV